MPEFNRGRNPQGQRSGGSRQGAPSRRPNPDRLQGRGGGQGCGPQRAAAPWYVGDNFSDAPPGHRYLMYLPFWSQDWNKIKEGKQQVLKTLCAIPPHARETMCALAQRQCDIGKGIGAEVIEAFSTSPFATGLGWEHPNENGFAFLHPYGLPYLAGSGVKGVLRDAAQELAEGLAGDAQSWTEDAVTALFGPKPEEIKKAEDASRGALRFFDVIPEIAGEGLGVDIMNPHYGDYYQAKQKDDRGREIYPNGATPHDAGSPVPIFFLVVPPGSQFTFVVDCPHEYLLPDNLRSKWRGMTRAAFTYAFDWFGFGAKTTVGYGAMVAAAPLDAPEQPAAAQLPSPVPSDPVEEIWQNATVKYNVSTRLMTAVKEGRKAEKGEAKSLFDGLNTTSLQKKTREGRLQVDVRIRRDVNGAITLLGLLFPVDDPQ